MFRTLTNKIRDWLRTIGTTITQGRRKKLAELAELEKKERKAVVEGLTKKIADARALCEQSQQSLTVIEVSLNEIIFIERTLSTWSRYIKESEIYEPRPRR